MEIFHYVHWQSAEFASVLDSLCLFFDVASEIPESLPSKILLFPEFTSVVLLLLQWITLCLSCIKAACE
jgi:hypothetical protein